MKMKLGKTNSNDNDSVFKTVNPTVHLASFQFHTKLHATKNFFLQIENLNYKKSNHSRLSLKSLYCF